MYNQKRRWVALFVALAVALVFVFLAIRNDSSQAPGIPKLGDDTNRPRAAAETRPSDRQTFVAVSAVADDGGRKPEPTTAGDSGEVAAAAIDGGELIACDGGVRRCPDDPFGVATCARDGKCGLACRVGFVACDGRCVVEDETHCGRTCSSCEGRGFDGGYSLCVIGRCESFCTPGYIRCDAGCCPSPPDNLPTTWPKAAIKGATDAQRIVLGNSHACVLSRAGGLSCWGRNREGQLGDGTTTQRLTPTPVEGLSRGVVSVSAGWAHTCAVTESGGLKCWGRNSRGELGVSSWDLREQPRPTDVPGLSTGVVAVSAGLSHTCALLTDGTARCWGVNTDGQLGDGTQIWRRTPVPVLLQRVQLVSVTAGGGQTCGATSRGGVVCWGYGGSRWSGGDLARADLARLLPHPIVGAASEIVDVRAGERQTCALTKQGGVKCWNEIVVPKGRNTSGYSRSAPVDLFGLESSAVAIDVGAGYGCALVAGGGLKCWVSAATWSGSDVAKAVVRTRGGMFPTDIFRFSSGVVDFAVGGEQVCVINAEATVECANLP